MIKILLLYLVAFAYTSLMAQPLLPPDRIYGELFHDVQMAKIFPDGKTFVDCVPKKNPAIILADYIKIKNNPAIRFSLQLFVEENFILPSKPAVHNLNNGNEDAATHIKSLWKVLSREPDAQVQGSSLLPLPHSYIVPGGRFREIYYWDSYFTMLGLQENSEYEIIENMVKNFAYLINTYGHIPNGNRTYYLSRSQPPFFSLMVSLLAEIKGDVVYTTYLPALEKEYRYWMEGTATLKNGQAIKHVVKLEDGAILNRYWDENPAPRQESYAEDVETAQKSGRNKSEMYRHLRAGAASGWDFSSRWLADAKKITSIATTEIIPVDLNCLLYMLEMNISRANVEIKNKIASEEYLKKAQKRKAAILKYAWNESFGFFTDFNFKKNKPDTMITAAGLFPLFAEVASPSQAEKVASLAKSTLLREGGIITTNNVTGQQWDAPNGWAPLQWIAIKGLENYNKKELAKNIALRWLALNDRVFKNTGKMMEKYNVMNISLEAGGGEYPSQDGFGWTNGVYLKLLNMYSK